MSIGEEVKNRRVSKGMNIDELAWRCGLTPHWVDRFENKLIKASPPIEVLVMLADALDTTIADLRGRSVHLKWNETILLSAATMPKDGVYDRRTLTQVEFIERIQEAEQKSLESFVGHVDTADHISRISGVNVQVSRRDSTIARYINILVCNLKSRVVNKDKPQHPTDDDFQYLEVAYMGRKERF